MSAVGNYEVVEVEFEVGAADANLFVTVPAPAGKVVLSGHPVKQKVSTTYSYFTTSNTPYVFPSEDGSALLVRVRPSMDPTSTFVVRLVCAEMGC